MHPVYRGTPRQYGGGLGSMFKSLMKTVIPMVKPQLQSAAKILKQEGIKQGVGAIQDLVEKGHTPKQVLKRRAQNLGKALVKRIKTPTLRENNHSTPKARAIQLKTHNLRSRNRRRRNRKLHLARKVSKSRPLDIFD